ncbi:hypothetical protein SAMD00019534_012510 [Acytostelium subglobosum LB1]|uniref:hypothetical protein n=1 Tax=Acytostelium subglobosum LB1 TaxID=1410327 RepID=UPI0006447C19|nr:hypothetical protein SAMD00019534_012510 [Acytostelium subglobosum LB1]GAM18076.1 hypothetical protein SAMD00019534_012510 [Acytostelium subglobosum LB1]|eukprot:XP_012758672.1 hypothetical protein SAMD00019534_012510 [Acytostelium subglobosum LB1]
MECQPPLPTYPRFAAGGAAAAAATTYDFENKHFSYSPSIPSPPLPSPRSSSPLVSHNTKNNIQVLENRLGQFWTHQLSVICQTEDFKSAHELPLARIKKIMKSDEQVNKVSVEVPVIFAKACEMFILEMTIRSWFHTESNKRRTLQRIDIANAFVKYDMYDFLIDIVPRDEISKPKKFFEELFKNYTLSPESLHFYQLQQQMSADKSMKRSHSESDNSNKSEEASPEASPKKLRSLSYDMSSQQRGQYAIQHQQQLGQQGMTVANHPHGHLQHRYSHPDLSCHTPSSTYSPPLIGGGSSGGASGGDIRTSPAPSPSLTSLYYMQQQGQQHQQQQQQQQQQQPGNGSSQAYYFNPTD